MEPPPQAAVVVVASGRRAMALLKALLARLILDTGGIINDDQVYYLHVSPRLLSDGVLTVLMGVGRGTCAKSTHTIGADEADLVHYSPTRPANERS